MSMKRSYKKKSMSPRSYKRRSSSKSFEEEGCKRRYLKKSCVSDPNCSWVTRRGCRKRGKKVYFGPALPERNEKRFMEEFEKY
jgi:hypothetical protein